MKAIWQVMLFADYSFELYQRILDLPPSAKFILYILRKNEFLNRKALENESLLPKRTIGEALQILLKEGFIEKISSEIVMKERFGPRKRSDNREIYYHLT